MTAEIELHGESTGNCLRVSVALEEAGIEYRVVKVDLRSGEHRQARHLSLNPAGKVPTIVHHAGEREPFVLSQSNAIMLYVDMLAPGVLLPEKDVRRRALALERYFYFLTDVIAPSHAAFRTGSTETGPRSLLGNAIAALLDSERFLRSNEFMSGDEFGMADIAALTFIRPYERFIAWDKAPLLYGWQQAVRGRAAVKRGLSAFDTPA